MRDHYAQSLDESDADRYRATSTARSRKRLPAVRPRDRESLVAERIEDYALLGDLQTAALVGRNGSIDWLPFPRFDSSSCFGALLGGREHGRWLLAPSGADRATRGRYRDDTLILESEWQTPTGRVRVIDFMPPRETKPDIVRIVEGLEGSVQMRTELVIRLRLRLGRPVGAPPRRRDAASRSAARTGCACGRRSTSSRRA